MAEPTASRNGSWNPKADPIISDLGNGYWGTKLGHIVDSNGDIVLVPPSYMTGAPQETLAQYLAAEQAAEQEYNAKLLSATDAIEHLRLNLGTTYVGYLRSAANSTRAIRTALGRG